MPARKHRTGADLDDWEARKARHVEQMEVARLRVQSLSNHTLLRPIEAAAMLGITCKSLAAAARERSAATRSPVVLVDHDVAEWLSPNTKREWPPHVIRDWLKAGGMIVGKDRHKVDGWRRQLVATIDTDGKKWSELKAYRAKLSELMEPEL